TDLGGEFASWEADGKKVHWSLGNSHFVYDVDKAKKFEDSLRIAKKDEEKRKTDSIAKAKAHPPKAQTDTTAKLLKDTTGKKTDSLGKKTPEKKEDPKYKPDEVQLKIWFAKDFPNSTVLLKGARVITMKGNEILENADILVVNNRIKAIGRSGSLSVPSGAKTIDVAGKTIIPGFVDTHSHMWPQWGIHKNQVWIYAANLAYGVTTTRDPQTATSD